MFVHFFSLSGAAFPKKGAKKEGAVVPFGKTAPSCIDLDFYLLDCFTFPFPSQPSGCNRHWLPVRWDKRTLSVQPLPSASESDAP